MIPDCVTFNLLCTCYLHLPFRISLFEVKVVYLHTSLRSDWIITSTNLINQPDVLESDQRHFDVNRSVPHLQVAVALLSVTDLATRGTMC